MNKHNSTITRSHKYNKSDFLSDFICKFTIYQLLANLQINIQIHMKQKTIFYLLANRVTVFFRELARLWLPHQLQIDSNTLLAFLKIIIRKWIRIEMSWWIYLTNYCWNCIILPKKSHDLYHFGQSIFILNHRNAQVINKY